MNIIYYQTKTQFENTGDALINNALINRLRNYGSLRCNCSSKIPTEFINELGIKKDEKIVCNNEIKLVLKILKDAIKSKKNKNIIYLFSGLGHHWGGGLKMNLKIVISTLILMIYRLFGVKIVRIGASIGPLKKTTSFFEKIKSTFVNYYYVRDTKSFEFCKKIGIKKVKICPDMSWLYLSEKEKK